MSMPGAVTLLTGALRGLARFARLFPFRSQALTGNRLGDLTYLCLGRRPRGRPCQHRPLPGRGRVAGRSAPHRPRLLPAHGDHPHPVRLAAAHDAP